MHIRKILKRAWRNGPEGGGSGSPPPPAPPPVVPPVAPAPPPVVPPAVPPAKPEPPALPPPEAPKQDPAANALSIQVKELLSKMEASEKRAQELADKNAKLEAQKETRELAKKLGYAEADDALTALEELVERRTVIHDGKRTWRNEDGTLLPLETGLKEFQKGIGKLFLRPLTKQVPAEDSTKQRVFRLAESTSIAQARARGR